MSCNRMILGIHQPLCQRGSRVSQVLFSRENKLISNREITWNPRNHLKSPELIWNHARYLRWFRWFWMISGDFKWFRTILNDFDGFTVFSDISSRQSFLLKSWNQLKSKNDEISLFPLPIFQEYLVHLKPCTWRTSTVPQHLCVRSIEFALSLISECKLLIKLNPIWERVSESTLISECMWRKV